MIPEFVVAETDRGVSISSTSESSINVPYT
jgi:hypothetical protein